MHPHGDLGENHVVVQNRHDKLVVHDSRLMPPSHNYRPTTTPHVILTLHDEDDDEDDDGGGGSLDLEDDESRTPTGSPRNLQQR